MNHINKQSKQRKVQVIQMDCIEIEEQSVDELSIGCQLWPVDTDPVDPELRPDTPPMTIWPVDLYDNQETDHLPTHQRQHQEYQMTAEDVLRLIVWILGEFSRANNQHLARLPQ